MDIIVDTKLSVKTILNSQRCNQETINEALILASKKGISTIVVQYILLMLLVRRRRHGLKKQDNFPTMVKVLQDKQKGDRRVKG